LNNITPRPRICKHAEPKFPSVEGWPRAPRADGVVGRIGRAEVPLDIF